jgi:hypothetical protein
LILEFSKNNPTAVLTEVADLLCMKFKSDFPNVQLLLRRTIQKCKDGDKSKKAESATAKNNPNESPAGAEGKEKVHHDPYAAYPPPGKTRPGRGSPGGAGGNKKQGGGRLKFDKTPGLPGVDESSHSPRTPGGTRRQRRRSGGNKNNKENAAASQVPELPQLSGKQPPGAGGGKARIMSGRGAPSAGELQAPGKNIRQWMHTKQLKVGRAVQVDEFSLPTA